MKQNNTTKSLATLLIVASATSLTAIERPVPADQPIEKKAKAQARERQIPMPIPEAKAKAKAPDIAYLGVMGDSITDAMSAQLNLGKNVGLTLLFVQEGSPAGIAGLKKHDIITKIGGVDIGNLNQLKLALRQHNPKDEIELNYISGGKKLTKQIQLGAVTQNRPQARQFRLEGQPKARGANRALKLDMLEKLPPEQRQQLEQLLQGNLNQLDFRNLKNLDVDQLQKHFQQFGKIPRQELKMGDLMKEGSQQKSRMKMLDRDGSLTLETEGDEKSIELHDTDGKLLYKGSFNNDADKLKIPQDLRARVNRLKLNDGPKVKILPNFRNIEGLRGLDKMGMPKEMEELLNKLQANGPRGAMGLLQIPQAGQQLNGDALMQKFEFNLNEAGANKNSSKTLLDPDGNKYTQSENKDGKEIEIKGPKGELLFSGPYNSSADKEMVPEEYRPSLNKLDRMEGIKGFKLELGQP